MSAPDNHESLFRAAQDGEQCALDTLVKQNIPLVKYIVRRFLGRGKEYDDLFQTGCIGLMKAIQRFDPGLNVRFSTYAVPLIMGEIRRYLRDDNSVHVSRSVQDAAARIRAFTDQYRIMQDKDPSIGYICKETGLDADIVLLAINSAQPVRSLSEPVGGDSDITIGETIIAQQDLSVDNRLIIDSLLNSLRPEDRNILEQRYFARKTQKEVGLATGKTQVQISRMESRILKQLRGLCQ